MKIDKLSDYLKQYGWLYKIIDDKTLSSQFKDTQGNIFTLWIKMIDGWITLTVIDYFLRIPEKKSLKLFEYLLLRNADSYIGRFALTNKYVIITADIDISKKVSYEQFIVTIEALVNMATKNIADLRDCVKAR